MLPLTIVGTPNVLLRGLTKLSPVKVKSGRIGVPPGLFVPPILFELPVLLTFCKSISLQLGLMGI